MDVDGDFHGWPYHVVLIIKWLIINVFFLQLIEHLLFYISYKFCKHSLKSIDSIAPVYELFDNVTFTIWLLLHILYIIYRDSYMYKMLCQKNLKNLLHTLSRFIPFALYFLWSYIVLWIHVKALDISNDDIELLSLVL